MEDTKRRCNFCGESWPLSGFYASKPWKCKECHNEYANCNRRVPGAALKRRPKVFSPEQLLEHARQRRQKWRERNPDKYRALYTINNAIAQGLLKRERCDRCGTDERVCAFPFDVAQPLNVYWRCRPCQRKAKKWLLSAR